MDTMILLEILVGFTLLPISLIIEYLYKDKIEED